MNSPSTLLEKEQRTVSRLTLFTAIASISGLITYFYQTNSAWQQITYLLHTIAGLFLSYHFVPYLIHHFKRTMGIRRPFLIVSGTLIVIVFFLLILSGLHITLFGQIESLRFIYDNHILLAYTSISIIAAHILIHHYTNRAKRKDSKLSQYPSITPALVKSTSNGIVISILMILFLSVIFKTLDTDYIDKAIYDTYQLPYGNHPFRPSQTETLSGSFYDVRRTGASDKCADCHEFITDEWRSSIHSQAASDKSYQTNINLLAKKKGMASTRYCEGCHAPVALLSGELTEGGRLDTTGHMKEGVSCMGCHGIDNVVHLQGVASYRFAPAKKYLFADVDNWIANQIHNFLVKIQPRQHRLDMARPILSDPTLCATCHTQFIDKDVNNWGWVKMQDEFGAWLNSPYSGQTEQSFSHNKVVKCHDCHMPMVKANDPSRNKYNMIKSHRTLGANTVIPWLNKDQVQLEKTIQFLQADKVRLNIEKPSRLKAVRSKKFVAPEIRTDKDSPAYFYLGEEVKLKVIVTNAQVGHNFPGGTLDINEAWLHLKVVDAQNMTVYESGAIRDDNDVDYNAYFYKSLPIDRNGKHIWKHDLFNMTGNSYKNFIPAGKSDLVDYKFTIPSWAKSPITVRAVLRYRKFNNKYAKWALKDNNIDPPIVDMARDAISLPIRIKKEIE